MGFYNACRDVVKMIDFRKLTFLSFLFNVLYIHIYIYISSRDIPLRVFSKAKIILSYSQIIMRVVKAFLVCGICFVPSNIHALSVPAFSLNEPKNVTSLQHTFLSTLFPHNDTLQLGDPYRPRWPDGGAVKIDPSHYLRFFHHGSSQPPFQVREVMHVLQATQWIAYEVLRHIPPPWPARGPAFSPDGSFIETQRGVTLVVTQRQQEHAIQALGSDDLALIVRALESHIYAFALPPFRFEYGLGDGTDHDGVLAGGLLCRLGDIACPRSQGTHHA